MTGPIRRRPVHGTQVKTRSGNTFESVSTSEVRSVPEGSAAPQAPRNDGKFTSESASEAARIRWELERQPDFGDKTHPWLPPASALAPFDAARRDLLSQRRKELHDLTGAVSSGVGGIVRGYAYIHAAGEYWASQFFASGDPEAFDRMVRAFKAASGEEARARDAAAWEADARRKLRPSDPHRAAFEAFGVREPSK